MNICELDFVRLYCTYILHHALQPTGRLALVFELMDMNIYELIRGRRQYLPEARIKSYMYQVACGNIEV